MYFYLLSHESFNFQNCILFFFRVFDLGILKSMPVHGHHTFYECLDCSICICMCKFVPEIRKITFLRFSKLLVIKNFQFLISTVLACTLFCCMLARNLSAICPTVPLSETHLFPFLQVEPPEGQKSSYKS